MKRRTWMLCMVVVFVALVGCSRHVVVEPDAVTQYKDVDWILKGRPAQSGR